MLVVDPGPTLALRLDGVSFARTGLGESRLYDDGADGPGEPYGDGSYGHVEGGALVFRRVRPGRPYTLWMMADCPFTSQGPYEPRQTER